MRDFVDPYGRPWSLVELFGPDGDPRQKPGAHRIPPDAVIVQIRAGWDHGVDFRVLLPAGWTTLAAPDLWDEIARTGSWMLDRLIDEAERRERYRCGRGVPAPGARRADPWGEASAPAA